MRRVFLAAAVVAIAIFIGAFFLLSDIGKPKPVSEEESLEIALEYVRNSPTFRFDGIDGSLEHVETFYPDVSTPYTWEFVFTFECRHSGYGDRTGQMLLEVITPHIAHVVVQERKVVTATLDGKWDIIKQEMILSPTPEIFSLLMSK